MNFKKINIFLFVIIILLLNSQLLMAKKMRIAVMDFKAMGVSKSLAKNVSELIRGEMINTNEFIIIERSQMNEILREQAFQKTGCTEVSCAVKLGKLLSARKILIGHVMKVGDVFVISGRIVDVEKGVSEYSARKSVETKRELISAAESFAITLTGRIEGSSPEISEGEKSTEVKNMKPEYYSPKTAGFSSVLPFWSGSWNNGFDIFGLCFVGLKIGSLYMINYSINSYNDRISELETENDNLDRAISKEDDFWDSADMESQQMDNDSDISKLEFQRTIVVTGEVFVFIAITTIDVLYSMYTIEESNLASSNIKKRGDGLYWRFSIAPRFSSYNSYSNYNVDGVNLTAVYKF